jgi:RimJ/RimL family protein N-acetyltransferase
MTGLAVLPWLQIKDDDMTRHGIELFPLTVLDFETLVAWITSRKQEIMWAGRTFRFPLDHDQLKVYLKTCRGDHPERLAFKAVDYNSREMLGGINFHRIDWENRMGRLGLVIVSPRRRGEGIGVQMVKLALALGFETYGLHRIELGVFDFNFLAIRCYERCGFIREGVQRHACRYKNEYWNLVMMSMLRSEWSTRRF